MDDELLILTAKDDVSCAASLEIRMFLCQLVGLDGQLITTGYVNFTPFGILAQLPVLVVGIQRVAVAADSHLLRTTLALAELDEVGIGPELGGTSFLDQLDKLCHLIIDDGNTRDS